jgi:hypothetical protein
MAMQILGSGGAPIVAHSLAEIGFAMATGGTFPAAGPFDSERDGPVAGALGVWADGAARAPEPCARGR